MGRSAAIVGHLPPLYREGEIVGQLAGVWGVEIDSLDESLLAIQRGHWFDATYDLREAAALAALLGFAPEPFHADLAEFRAWVHALTDARLQAGAVTREALRILTDTYAEGFQRAAGIGLVPRIGAWGADGDDEAPRLIENPHRFRSARLPVAGGWEPLARLEVVNAGTEDAPWAVVLTGTAAEAEYAPFIANRTTGDAIVFRGAVGLGQRLTIAPRANDRSLLAADLEGHDVTDRLDVYPALTLGAGGPGPVGPTRAAPVLARGPNELWFLPLAHFDTPGLDRFLLALAGEPLRTGRFDRTVFDQSLFVQEPRMAAWVAWVEREPASFEVHLPGRALLGRPGRAAADGAARDRLEAGLDAAVDRSAGAGVATDVVLTRHRERQPGRDRLRMAMPIVARSVGPTGGDRLAESGGLFDVTDFDESTLS